MDLDIEMLGAQSSSAVPPNEPEMDSRRPPSAFLNRTTSAPFLVSADYWRPEPIYAFESRDLPYRPTPDELEHLSRLKPGPVERPGGAQADSNASVHPVTGEPPAADWPSTPLADFFTGRVLTVNYFWDQKSKRVSVTHTETRADEDTVSAYLSAPIPTLRIIHATMPAKGTERLMAQFESEIQCQEKLRTMMEYIGMRYDICGTAVPTDNCVMPLVSNPSAGHIQGTSVLNYPITIDVSSISIKKKSRIQPSDYSRPLLPELPDSQCFLQTGAKGTNKKEEFDALVYLQPAIMQVSLQHVDFERPTNRYRSHPFELESMAIGDHHRSRPRMTGNTVMILDHPNCLNNGNVKPLIPWRGLAESVWIDRLGELSNQQFDSEADFLHFAIELAHKGVFQSLDDQWTAVFDKLKSHMDCLRSLLYKQWTKPSQAFDLWQSVFYWIAVNRVDAISQQVQESAEMVASHQALLGHMTGTEPSKWLADIYKRFQAHEETVRVVLEQPLNRMSELVFQLMQNQDAAATIEMSDTMWGLAWISFIFLPLSFVASFFGMNVDWLENNPSGVYYIIASAALLVTLIFLWIVFKDVLFPDSRKAAAQTHEFDIEAQAYSRKYGPMWDNEVSSFRESRRLGCHGLLIWLVLKVFHRRGNNADVFGLPVRRLDWWSRLSMWTVRKMVEKWFGLWKEKYVSKQD